jgi:hypothetical protein
MNGGLFFETVKFAQKIMKRIVLLTISVFCLSACSTKTNPLCECIQKSESLNNLSSEILSSEIVSQEKQKELFRLRKEIDSVCAPFKMMGPEELYKMRNECIDEEMKKVTEE